MELDATDKKQRLSDITKQNASTLGLENEMVDFKRTNNVISTGLDCEVF